MEKSSLSTVTEDNDEMAIQTVVKSKKWSDLYKLRDSGELLYSVSEKFPEGSLFSGCEGISWKVRLPGGTVVELLNEMSGISRRIIELKANGRVVADWSYSL